MTVDKDGLRSNFKRKLHDLNPDDKKAQSEMITSRVCEFLKTQSGTWTLFSPLNDEPNLLTLFNQCDHLKWVFPKVESKTSMSFFAIQCPNELVASSWGLEEPPANSELKITQDQITGCLIPGIAFDVYGTRLGRGGGYYDRFLENFKGLKLGVTFNQGLTEEALPRKPHDQQMNIVISPEKWIEVETSEVTNGV